MEVFYVVIAAFMGATITFFSGFGLATVLTPVFMIFFPAELSIALIGLVHLFNNLYKLVLVGKYANKKITLRFGFPALIFAILGAFILVQITSIPPLFSYTIFDKKIIIYPVKFIISITLIVFSILELFTYLKNIKLGTNNLILGGILSGFFGGLSGNQGALRSAFLVKTGLTKEAFIATGAVVSTFVDFGRLAMYTSNYINAAIKDHLTLITAATLAALAGTFLGNIFLKKITIKFIQIFVAIILLIMSILMAAGLL